MNTRTYWIFGFWLCTSLGAALSLAQSSAHALEPRDFPPPFSLPSLSGQSTSLNDFRGKVVYLDFWASWCVPCRHTLPWMNHLMRDLQGKFGNQDFSVVAVNVDENRADAQKILAEIGAHFPVLFDSEGKVAEQYQLPGMPTSFVIDRDGRIVAVHSGFHDGDEQLIEQELASLLSK